MAILRKPRIREKKTSLKGHQEKDVNLIRFAREQKEGKIIGWPRNEVLARKLAEVPKDLRLYESHEWIKQLEMALTQRKAQAFPVGSRRGAWLLETLNDLGLSVETGLSADKKWVMVHDISLPKKTQGPALPRTVLTTAKPKVRSNRKGQATVVKGSAKQTSGTKKSGTKKPTVEEKEDKKKGERTAKPKAVSPAELEKAREEVITSLMPRVNRDPHIKDKELFVGVVREILAGKSAIGIAFFRKIDEGIVIYVRKKLIDLLIGCSYDNPEIGESLEQLDLFTKMRNLKLVSPRFVEAVKREEVPLKVLEENLRRGK